jgi:uncharacterized repeat protein (TIGR01451 family)
LLTLFLSALPYPGVEAGGVITYAITVVNEGPVDAARVLVTDCLPTYITFLSPLSSPAPEVGPRTVWWELGPLVGNGAESRSVTFTVRVAPTAPTGMELVNRVVATADGGDPAAAVLAHRVNRFQAQIGPEEGGRLRALLTGLEAHFPAGAVSERVQISLTVMTTPTQEARAFQLVGRVFFLEGVDAQGDSVTSFLRPYTLTVRYEDEEWQAAGLEQETDLNLFYWHQGRWVPVLPCPGCRVDTEANRVVAVLDHFTEFALGQTQEVFLPLVVRGR